MPLVLYVSVVVSLKYAVVCTRLDIAHVVGILRRCISKLGKVHWIVLKRVFKNFHGTIGYGSYWD